MLKVRNAMLKKGFLLTSLFLMFLLVAQTVAACGTPSLTPGINPAAAATPQQI